MSADVEMTALPRDPAPDAPPSAPASAASASNPPPSPTSPTSPASAHDDLDPDPDPEPNPDDPDDDSSADSEADTDDDEPEHEHDHDAMPVDPPPASGKEAPAPAPPPPASQSAKPKSTKRKARTPSPTPPAPPPPVPTIRLSIRLGGPDNYAVDIAALAKATGQLPDIPAPPPPAHDPDSDDDADDEGPKSHLPGDKSETEGGKRKRKRKAQAAAYDLTDPFIDDSDLALDERAFFAQTKQSGFYVSSGEVVLLKEKHTPKKPKSHKPLPAQPLLLPLPPPSQHPSYAYSGMGPSSGAHESASVSASMGGGSPDVDSEMGGGGGVKRKAEEMAVALSWDAPQRKRKKGVDIHPFHPELQGLVEELKGKISQESWEKKGKFPPNLKPFLTAVAVQAIRLNEYNDNFFNLMPLIFPYNRFTMQKLIKRMVWSEHIQILNERQTELLAELRRLADEGFEKAQEDHKIGVSAWEKKQREKEASAAPSADSTPVPTAEEAGEGGAGKESHPPPKKYKLTDEMKNIIWTLVCLSNECCRIENEKNQLESVASVVSEQGLRKTLYQKIVAAFPEGWMTSGQISREMSTLKKKYGTADDKMDQD